jgi:hypothetical protein
MIVLPATSTVFAPAGMLTWERGPTSTMRSPRTTMTPSSMIPPSAPAMVTIRAPVRATVPEGRSAATSIDSDSPAVGGWNFGAFSAGGAEPNRVAVSTV